MAHMYALPCTTPLRYTSLLLKETGVGKTLYIVIPSPSPDHRAGSGLEHTFNIAPDNTRYYWGKNNSPELFSPQQ